MKIIKKQDLPSIKQGTLLATNDGQDEPWNPFILGDLYIEDGVVRDFYMISPMTGEITRDAMYDDDDTYIMFDEVEIAAMIERLLNAAKTQFP